jgi:dTDP-glucose 4,6-dehydratase
MNKILASLLERDLKRVVADLEGKLHELKESSIAVIGGTGFLGTWIALIIDFLNAEYGFNTRLLLCSRSASDDFCESLPIRNRLGIQPYRYDVLSPAELPSVDWMIHAAATPDGRLHSSNPIQTLSTLVMGTNNVLAAATRLNELRALLYVSSGLVYGESPSALPTIAEDGFGKLECNSLQAAYAEGKRAAESLCAAYRSQSRLPIVIARPFSLVGPFQSLDLPWAANNFMRDGLNGSTIRIQGDGEAIRSYMHGADFALWSLRALVAGRDGTAYNIGSPHGTSLLSLAAAISEHLPHRPKVAVGRLQIGRNLRANWVPDVSRAQDELGLKCAYSSVEAVRATLSFHLLNEAIKGTV